MKNFLYYKTNKPPIETLNEEFLHPQIITYSAYNVKRKSPSSHFYQVLKVCLQKGSKELVCYSMVKTHSFFISAALALLSYCVKALLSSRKHHCFSDICCNTIILVCEKKRNRMGGFSCKWHETILCISEDQTMVGE